MRILVYMMLSVISAVPTAAEQSLNPPAVSIIPRPVKLEANKGSFPITRETRIVADGVAAKEASKLQDLLAPAMGFRLPMIDVSTGRENVISFVLDKDLPDVGNEGYSITVTPQGANIRARQAAGLFYAIQTLRQLLPCDVYRRAKVQNDRWEIPCVTITDYPRFKWRGLMLDTARHFIPKDAILDFIDAMAVHKLNSLQLHLTDDQGWRIEIRKYPRLTGIGAWRNETLAGHAGDEPQRYDGRRHGGFYTQDDIREIVRYAADRHITVVPEIEMPGHSRAAISAYPQLGCNPDKQLEPWTRWGVCSDICAPTDQTIRFMKDVLTEVMELFPSRFIHVGGDEAAKDQWRSSPAVQARIKQLGLKDEDELQSWFIEQIDAFLTENGRRLVGWDEILEGGLAPGATVMSWRGIESGIAAARAGHDVVMAPTSHTYLDYYQGPVSTEPLAIGGNLPLDKVYSYEPIPGQLQTEQASRILGAQGQLWTEYIKTPCHLQYMAFPRAIALAEVVWIPKEDKDYRGFRLRLEKHVKRLDAMGVNFRCLDVGPPDSYSRPPASPTE